jgi:hypothetical protein
VRKLLGTLTFMMALSFFSPAASMAATPTPPAPAVQKDGDKDGDKDDQKKRCHHRHHRKHHHKRHHKNPQNNSSSTNS